MSVIIGICLCLLEVLKRGGVTLEYLTALLKEGGEESRNGFVGNDRGIEVPHCGSTAVEHLEGDARAGVDCRGNTLGHRHALGCNRVSNGNTCMSAIGSSAEKRAAGRCPDEGKKHCLAVAAKAVLIGCEYIGNIYGEAGHKSVNLFMLLAVLRKSKKFII